MITEQDKQKYHSHTDEAILGIKLIGGLTDEALLTAREEIKSGNFGVVLDAIKALMDARHTYEMVPKMKTNPIWIIARIADELQDRRLITNEEHDSLPDATLFRKT